MAKERLKLVDTEREIEIEGVPFVIEAGDLEAIEAAQGIYKQYAETDVSALGVDDYMEMAKTIHGAIDAILGEGAVSRIVEARRIEKPYRKAAISIIHLTNILVYVIKAMSEVNVENAELDGVIADLTATVPEE